MVPIFIILTLAVLFFMFLYILYYKTFYNSPHRQARHKHSLKIDECYRPKLRQIRKDLCNASYEQVCIESRDGKRLAGKYYHNKDNAPIALIFHGYRGSSSSDPAGGYKILRDLGINILLPDQRAHGKSEGRTITFGIKERFDCLDWVEYLNTRFEHPDILLVGVSMGAATVLMASGTQLPANVKGMIADCGYSSPEAIIRKVLSKDMKLPHRLVFPFVRLAGRIFGGFDVCSYDAVKAVTDAKQPILIIHGEADDFVPCEMAYEIKGAGNCQLYTVPKATHGMSYIYNTEEYTEKVKDFINNLS